MKTIRHTDDMRAALAAAQAASVTVSTSATVDQGLKQWLKIHSIGNKPRSVEFNKDLSACIRARWPNLKTIIADVTPEQCIVFAEAIGHFSSSRYNGMVNAIRSFVPAAKFLPRKKIKLTDGASACPTPEEFDRLLAALDCAQSGRAGLVVRFLAHTGLRINEARQLTWDDVKEDHIYARGEITKNSQPRTIPFITGTREVLRALKLVTGKDGSRANKILPQLNCKTALKFASRLAGLPRYGHHAFRHYFATRCIVSGVDIPTVARWLGHKDNGVLLLRTYCHLMDEHSVMMAQRVKLGSNLANPESFVTLYPTDDCFLGAGVKHTKATPPAPAPAPEMHIAAMADNNSLRESMAFHFAN